MPTNTYVALQTQTLSSAVSTITFSSINQGYTDLVLVMNAGQTSPSINSTRVRVGNGSVDSGSNYSQTVLAGNGSSALSTRQSNISYIDLDYYAAPGISGDLNIIIANFMNYSNTTTNKTVLHRAGKATNGTDAIVSLWRSTAAINTIQLFTASGNTWTVGSTFTLYGIANSNIGAPKAFGGTITQDATYTYHTFGASGTFTPQQALTADVLVIAGGAGGGYGYYGGGGGAGGVCYQTGRSLTTSAYSISVGSGGAGSTNTSNKGSNGSNSTLDGITAVGGGGGGSRSNVNGADGGSGGGGAQAGSGSTGGAATQGNSSGATGYGFRGGNLNSAANIVSAGGGGAGAQGEDKTSNGTAAGSGGNGLNTWATWSVVTGTGVNGYYAGGGAGSTGNPPITGGAGGLGGGANGVSTGNGIAGTTNTGGGGSGGANLNSGGAGGSGIVIIRYAN